MRRLVQTAILVALLLGLAGLASTATAQVGPCGETVRVVYGDTLIDIAERCETTVDAILDANPQIENTRAIPVGTELNMPASQDRDDDTTTYIVKRGDTLFGIASRFDTTISALMEANPEITNPALIYVGQQLTIPGQGDGEPDGATLTVEPQRGRSDDTVLLDADNFPANTPVDIGFGRPESEFDVIEQARTNAVGSLDRVVTVPDFAESDRPWVWVVTTEDRSIKAISDHFTVLPDQPEEPTVTISPTSGPAGTSVEVHATGFPAEIEVSIGVGRANSEPTTQVPGTTNANGEINTQVEIPNTAEPGEPWVVVVAAPDRRLSAISNTFTVTEQQTGRFERTNIYLIALEDEGRTGEPIGCNDSVVPVEVDIEPTNAPMTAAYETLFSIDSRTYGQSGLENALFQSDLRVDSINITNGHAIVRLNGTLMPRGTCDVPRIEAQLHNIALQYDTVDSVTVYIDGQPLDDILSARG